MRAKLGVIAGGGALPRQAIAAARRRGRGVAAVALEGMADRGTGEGVEGVERVRLPPGAFGRMIAFLRRSGAEEVLLAGRVARPDWSRIALDWRALRALPRVLAADKGDGAALSVVVRELEGEGFRVVGIDSVAPELLAGSGVLGAVRPSRAQRADIDRGLAVLAALGPHDVGQAAAVRGGIVLGVEAAEGTDALIARCGALQPPGRGAVLVKCAKPGQDRRVDLPAIGPETVRVMAGAGFAGAAVEAGAALVLERAEAIAAADRARLFLCGVDAAP